MRYTHCSVHKKSRLKMNSILNHYIIYISIFSYCTSCTMCLLSGESIRRDKDEMNNKFQISDEEIARRHQLVKPHLLDISDKQKDWVETYHLSFSSNEIPSTEKVLLEDLASKEYTIHNIPLIDEVGRSLEQEHLETGKIQIQRQQFDTDGQGTSSDNVADPTFMTSKSHPLNPEEYSHRHKIIEDTKKSIPEPRTVDTASPEFIKIEKDIKIHPSTASNGKQESSVDEKILDSVSKENDIFAKESVTENIDSDVLKTGIEKFIETSYLNSETERFNILLSNFEKPESVDSKDKFTLNSEDILSDNSEDIISNHKIVEAPSSELSKPDLDQNESYHMTVNNTKEKTLHTVKELTDSKVKEINKAEDFMLYEVTPEEKDEESSSTIAEYKEEKNGLQKNDDIALKEKLLIVKEFLKRQNLVKSFISSLNQEKENWKETYHFNFKETDSGKVWESPYSDLQNPADDVENIIAKVSQPLQINEGPYFNRWLKRLLNKFADYPYSKAISISFPITIDSLNDLKKLSASGKFDVSTADELISDLISNATVHYGYKLSNFYDIFAGLSFIVISIILSVLMYFILLYYPIFRIILILVIFILWHAFKMYQEKVAQKQSTVSGIAPAYCESILTKESGMYAHIKEYFRYNTYNDQCKKYFEALMIDPISELSMPIVIADFASSTFFQLFKPMAHALNSFVKELFFDLSYTQTFYLIVLVIFFLLFCIVCILIYNRYKLNFPFFMGSLEPSAIPVGSRVEDLALGPNSVKESPVKQITVSYKYDISLIHDKKDRANSLVQHKNDCQNRKSVQLIRRFSF